MPEGVHDSQNNHEKTAFPAGQTEAAAALQEGRGNKNQKGKKAAIIAACVLAAVIVAGGGAYAAMAQEGIFPEYNHQRYERFGAYGG